jgi:hypothetical protein
MRHDENRKRQRGMTGMISADGCSASWWITFVAITAEADFSELPP